MDNGIFRKAKVKGIAATVPKEILDLKCLSDTFGEKNINKIMKVTGIEAVRRAPEGMTASDYSVDSAKRLMSELNVSPNEIDGIVYITESPDYIVPHTSAIIQERLHLPKSVIAFDINYGCAGYVYGLFQAFLLVESGYCNNVLLCAGDTLSRKVNSRDKASQMVLGDAGTATIISNDASGSRTMFSFLTDGSGADFLIIPAGAARQPHKSGVTDILKEDVDGNARTDEDFYMNGMEVMEFTLHDVKNVIHEVLGKSGLKASDVNLFALHQANDLIVKYIRKQLKVNKDIAPFGIQNFGNSSSGSIPVILCNLYPGINKHFKNVVAAGYGTGLSCAVGIFDFSNTVFMPINEI